MVIGSGMLWGEAYDYAMCILEEMQWIKTKSIHAAEFVTQRCEIIKFVRGSIGGSTVIDMMVLVQEEGDFVVTLPRRAVALTTGVTNEEWTLRLKYTRGGCCQRE